MTDTLTDVAPEPPRDSWGRYLVNGTAYTRATTIAKTLDDGEGLNKWMKRQVALGMAQRSDLVAAAATTDPGDKKALLTIADAAMETAGSSAAARVGTALHRATELADLGHPVPDVFAERVAEYQRALTAAGVEVCTDAIERIHVIHDDKVAGMADRHVTIDGRRHILDLKTGATLYPQAIPGFAIQLAIYANADNLFDPTTGDLEPVPEIDRTRGIICHLPADGGPCTLHWIDLTAGWDAYRQARWVRDWRRRKDLLTPLDVTVDDTPDRAARIVELLRPIVAADRDLFARRWRNDLTDVPGPKKADQWTTEQMDAVEAAFLLPFTDDPLPAAPPVDADIVRLRPPEPDHHGRMVDPAEAKALKERIRHLPRGAAGWMLQWHDEAIAAGHAWKMARSNSEISEGSFWRSTTGYWLARLANDSDTAIDDVRRVLATILGDPALIPTITIGDSIGSLDLDQARRAATLALATHEGSVRVLNDGLLEVVA